MNCIVLSLLTLALSLAPVFCWAAEPNAGQAPAAAVETQPQASDDVTTQLKAAQDERIKVLTQLVEGLMSQYKAGTADFVQVSSAQDELCDAQLDSTDEPEKRVAVLTTQLRGQTMSSRSCKPDTMRAPYLIQMSFGPSRHTSPSKSSCCENATGRGRRPGEAAWIGFRFMARFRSPAAISSTARSRSCPQGKRAAWPPRRSWWTAVIDLIAAPAPRRGQRRSSSGGLFPGKSFRELRQGSQRRTASSSGRERPSLPTRAIIHAISTWINGTRLWCAMFQRRPLLRQRGHESSRIAPTQQSWHALGSVLARDNRAEDPKRDRGSRWVTATAWLARAHAT